MPLDPDEDASAPLDLPIETGRARSQPKPVVEESFVWGVAGAFQQRGELLTAPGTYGVIRYVTSGVEYAPPPLPQSSLWRSIPSEPGRYEMPWTGDPGAVRTLKDLRKDLEAAARAQKLTHPNHPLLIELDEVTQAFIRLASRLHDARWSLGLLQPTNVILRNGEVVPIDLGFAWKGAYGSPPWDDSPGRPDWLDSTTQPTWLWDHDPVRQQFAGPDNGVFPPADTTQDIRTLGRLLAWLVSGQTMRDLPMLGGAASPPPHWVTLVEASAGRIPTAEALAQRFSEAPLSEHFCPKKVTTGGSRGKVLAGIVSVLLLVAVGAGGYLYLAPKKPEPSRGNPPPDLVTNSKEHEVGILLVGGLGAVPPSQQLPAPPANAAALLEALDQAIKSADVPKLLDSVKEILAAPGGATALEPHRPKVLGLLITEAQQAIQLAGDPVRRLEAKQRLDALVVELTKLTRSAPAADSAQKSEEERCLAYVLEFTRQLAQSP